MTEDLIDALLARMEERLPTLLSDVWNEQADADADRGEETPLVEPVLYLFGRRMSDPFEFPAVIIWQEASDLEDVGPTQGAGTNTASGWATLAHTLVIAVVLASDDEVTLERQLSRYRTATYRFLLGHQIVVGETAYDLQLLRVGRESEVGSVRINAPGVRGLLWDVIARGEENF